MADSLYTNPGPDNNVAPKFVVPCSILAAIALGLCTARIITRVRAKRIFLDDYLIALAEIGSLAGFLTACAAVAYGWGRKSVYVTPGNLTKALKASFAQQVIWIVSLATVRISVACSLLRFGSDWLWRGILFVLIALQILTSTGWLIIQFAQCRPLRANWEAVVDVQCWPTNAIIDYGWACSSFYVLMDLVLAMMPVRLVRSLNRSLREKILIGCLMATGLLATCIAGVKMTTFKDVGNYGDPLQATITPSLYAKLEELVGIIAACMPCLKSPAERLLRNVGIMSERWSPSFAYFSGLSGERGVTMHTIEETGTTPTTADGTVKSEPKSGDLRVDSASGRIYLDPRVREQMARENNVSTPTLGTSQAESPRDAPERQNWNVV